MLLSLGLKIGASILGLLLSIVLARALGIDTFGLYSTLVASASFLSLLALSGLSTYNLKMAAVAHADGSRLKSEKVLGGNILAGVRNYFLVVLPFAAMFFAFTGNTSLAFLLFVLLLGAAQVLARILESTLIGHSSVLRSQIGEKVVYYLVFLAILALLLPVSRIEFVLAAHLVSALCSLALASIFVCRLVGVKGWFTGTSIPSLKTLLPFGVISVLGAVSGQLDLLVLSAVSTSDQVAVYKVGSALATFVIFAMTAIDTVFFPRCVKHYSSGRIDLLQAEASRAARWSTVCGLAVCIPIVLLGERVIAVLYGGEFIGAYPVLAIIAIAQLINSATGSPHGILNLIGHERITMKVALIGLALGTVGSFVLARTYGALGAAVSISAYIVLTNVVLMILLWRMAGVWSGFTIRRSAL